MKSFTLKKRIPHVMDGCNLAVVGMQGQLTTLEMQTWWALHYLRIELKHADFAADRADPLKVALLNRKPSAQMRKRRAQALGCDDWYRRPDGRLAGQLVLAL